MQNNISLQLQFSSSHVILLGTQICHVDCVRNCFQKSKYSWSHHFPEYIHNNGFKNDNKLKELYVICRILPKKAILSWEIRFKTLVENPTLFKLSSKVLDQYQCFRYQLMPIHIAYMIYHIRLRLIISVTISVM